MKNFLNISFKFKDLLINLTFLFILFILFSLFFSYKKILIVFVISILFFFLHNKYKKIIIINLTFLIVLLKIIFVFFDPSNTLSKTVYEKYFLYGVKNLNIFETIHGGSLDPGNKIKSKTINIITDELGFRNNLDFKNADYILIGDSFIHSLRIDNKHIINVQLNEKTLYKFYNAALSTQDIGHYFETIKYFKDQNYNKKFIMFVFTGNDFLDYKTIPKNYSNYLNNNFVRNYFELKQFFDLHTKFRFILSFFNKNTLHEKVDKNQTINSKKILFYKSYYIQPDQNLKFSKKFNIYKKFNPDILIVIPTKAQVYCDYLDNYKCPNVNYNEVLNNTKLFSNTKVFDSTLYLKNKAAEILLENKFIFESDDTHLNELGLDVLSDFVLDNLNE